MTMRSDNEVLDEVERLLNHGDPAPQRQRSTEVIPAATAPPERRPMGRLKGALIGTLGGLVVLGAVAAIVLVVGQSPEPAAAPTTTAAATTTTSTTTTTTTSTTVPLPPAQVVSGAGLLGAVGGTSTRADGELVAYPGQPLTAPTPVEGVTAQGWQWVTCTDAETLSGCADVPDATGERFASPPVPEQMTVRVVVQLDVGGGSTVYVASAVVLAQPWPDGVEPGAQPTTTLPPTTTEAPTTTAAPTTEAPTTTAVPRNAYGDTIGATIVTPENPAAAYAVAVASGSPVNAPAGSVPALYAEWVRAMRRGAPAGAVVATADGYAVEADRPVELRPVVDETGNISAIVECVDPAGCRDLAHTVILEAPCAPGPGCSTLVSASGRIVTPQVAAWFHRDPAVSLLFSIETTEQVISISDPAGAAAYTPGTAFYVVSLPGLPAPGTSQDFAVDLGPDRRPDRLTIHYG